VVVGENKSLENISVRAVFTDREEASKFVLGPKRNYFDDRSEIVPLILDKEI